MAQPLRCSGPESESCSIESGRLGGVGVDHDGQGEAGGKTHNSPSHSSLLFIFMVGGRFQVPDY
jgi:hypothetical protein